MISEKRIKELANAIPGFIWFEGCSHESGVLIQEAIEFARAIESAVIEKIKSQGPVEDPRDAKIASLQAKIDALMLEYCPEEMTPEQMEGWGKHQVVYEDPRDKSDWHGPDWTERDTEYLK